jgi:hypothetical protein
MIMKGDTVSVNFHNAQFTLCRIAEVIYKPVATGDSWIFLDIETGQLHHVSEGCTISKLSVTE